MRDNPTPTEAAARKLISTLDMPYKWYSQSVPRKLWQAKIYEHNTTSYYILDFYWPELGLAVEIDGASHNDVYKQKQDQLRDYYLKQFGIITLRFPDYVITDTPDHFLNQLTTTIKRLEHDHANQTNPV